ncbi:hypothetical protein HMN09_00181800 [Mycena chlorophos]|uniref:Uncharacterized protein n=1 Tax=Mycena chlorophos TaxID=658473 RepID=A0A8H6TQH7_MYCCL|nr:hypothetical protein HMN09_00181800 [Mycena chlorophos]
MYSGHYGLCYYLQGGAVALPLLAVRADASIKDLAAQVKLIQTYVNDGTVAIEATYTFPIPARGAVCSFAMIKQDETRVVGVVKEKEDARKMYDAAVVAGQRASLLEQHTPDVFQVSVGNIQPQEQVKIELVYATELAEDEESDSIRFHLPVHIGSRYGVSPTAHRPSFRFISLWTSPSAFLTVGLSVEAQAPITKIGSPSHTVSTELGPDPSLPNFKDLPFSNYARVSLSSDAMLTKDFVLTVKSAGLDAPRCVAELHPSNETLALGLTLVPRFKLPDVSRQEFVLLVDRSGSMDGRRIEAAKKALVVMLRAIPHKDSLFQIVSFGSSCSSMWPGGSKPYNQETLLQATQYVDSMEANYGGTEIRVALNHCFRMRKTDRPLSILMLTDGDAWDVDGVLEECKTAVQGAPKNAYVRISVLGIGNSASTAMCEGIARVGNGVCMMVGEQEMNFTGKISRMLTATKAPPITDISVDWGQHAPDDDDDDFEVVNSPPKRDPVPPTKFNIFDESILDPLAIADHSTSVPPPPPVVLSPPPYLQQSPFKIRNLFPNVRLNVYAILQDKNVPKTVTVRGRTPDGANIELPIPVSLSHLPNAVGASPALHALAARKIIQDLEEGRHDVATSVGNPDDADLVARTVKGMVVRLGTTYSIASTHTSFVAVDESKPEMSLVTVAPVDFSSNAPPLRMYPGSVPSSLSLSSSRRALPSPPQPKLNSSVPAGRSRHRSGEFVVPSSLRGGSARLSMRSEAPPLLGQSSSSYAREAYATIATPPRQLDEFLLGQPSRDVASQFLPRGKPTPVSSRPPTGSKPLKPMQPPAQQQQQRVDPLEALARMQSFDGRFALRDVLTIVKLAPSASIEAVRAALAGTWSDGDIATLLAMAFLANKLGAEVERDAWEGVYQKAKQYLEDNSQPKPPANREQIPRHAPAFPFDLTMPKETKPKRKAAEKAEKGGRKKKDPNAPKRALSAYMFFSQAARKDVQAENPDASFGEVGKLLGAKWKEMDEEERKPYTDMAADDKIRAEREKNEYEASNKSANASGGDDDDDEE